MVDTEHATDTREVRWTAEPGAPATAEVAGFADIATACDWLASVRGELGTALREHGALYLRGLPVRDVEDFARVRDVLITRRTPYREKATPRSDFGDGVFSSTDLPPSQAIRLHNENSYTLTFPGLLLFGCLVAPEQGGATPVADCRAVLRALPAGVVDRIRATGWRLTRNYSDHLSLDWRAAFATESAEEAERYCEENLIGYGWGESGSLRTSQIRPGIIRHPDTGDEVWFNHLAFWNAWSLDEELREALVDECGPDGLPFQTDFGAGEPITRADLDAVNAAYAGATVRNAWRPGDVMLVDNILTAHGRDPFRGDRRIVVAMGDPVAIADCPADVRPAAGEVGR